MSYLAALDRAARGQSEALPRPLSRFEQPDVEWGEAEALTDAAPADSAVQRRDADPARPKIDPAPGQVTAAPLIPPISAKPVATPTNDAAIPLPLPPAAVTPSSASRPVEGQPPDPSMRAAAPATVTPISLAAPQPVSRVATRTAQLVELSPPGSDHTAAAQAQPPPLPQGEKLLPSKPQVATLLPPPDPVPAAELTQAAQAPAAPAAPDIIIEIGQIDIRIDAPARAAPPVTAARRATPVLSLDDYLRGRT